jgi:Lipopolysaccharide-assembly
MSHTRSFASSLLVGLSLLLASCAGYQLGPVKPDRMKDIATVAVPTFKNLTLEPRSAVLITNEVIRRFQQDGTYQVTTPDHADAVVKAQIKEIKRRPLRGARFNTLKTREMEFQLLVDFTVEDAKTHVVLTEGQSRGLSTIFLDPNFQLSERQALQEAAEAVARDIVGRMAEGIPGQGSIGGRGRSIGGNADY